jgi:hypothetical protein
MDYPDYLPTYVLGGTLAIVIVLLLGLNRSLRRARWQDSERWSAVWGGAALLTAWCISALALVSIGFYRGSPSRVPTSPYGVFLPIVAGIVLFRFWPALRRVLEAVPQEWIVGVQLYRALGLIFLVLYAQGRLPGVFAWPAGTGDVAVGLLAPAVAIAYAQRSRHAAGWVHAWNLLGIADLVVAVGTGFLSSPSPLQMLALDAPNELISRFPLAMVPVFLVPLSVLLHLASLKKLQAAETVRRPARFVVAGERN